MMKMSFAQILRHEGRISIYYLNIFIIDMSSCGGNYDSTIK